MSHCDALGEAFFSPANPESCEKLLSSHEFIRIFFFFFTCFDTRITLWVGLHLSQDDKFCANDEHRETRFS